MPLTKAQCANCGAILNIDSTQDTTICSFCGTPYIIEKPINNYQTFNISGIDSEYARIKGMADYSLANGAYDEAYNHFLLIFNKYRHVDYNNIILLIKAYTHNYSFEYITNYINIYSSHATSTDIALSLRHLEDYTSKLKSFNSWIPQNIYNEDIKSINELVSQLENKINKLQIELNEIKKQQEKDTTNLKSEIKLRKRRLLLIKILLFPIAFAIEGIGIAIESDFFIGLSGLGLLIAVIVAIKVKCGPVGQYYWK
jgi:hypothetical protein